ncbi:hypothetical protein GGI24_000870 [Coemansia furcata]|nr:hypothetical protein GGI24_000870 [Coemansia furcata]
MDGEDAPQLADSTPPPKKEEEEGENATNNSTTPTPVQQQQQQPDNLSPAAAAALVDDAIVPNTPAAEVADEEEEEEGAGSVATAAAQEGDISGGYSTTSSLYGGSLIGGGGGGGAGTSINDGRASIVGLAPTLGGGTLSPPHTLVNSDGASMRVHTGSIRERNFNRRISAIHEDDSDVYSESRRSDSMIFSQPQQQPSSVSPSHYHQMNYLGRRRHNNRSLQRRMSEDDNNGCMPRVLSESDCLSIVSGISEGGASTTCVRLATDRAYDALRIGAPQAALAAAGHLGFGYIHHHHQHQHHQYPHRATSFATSSDPGLPSTGSYYDYYLDPNDYVPNSGSTRDDDDDDHGDSDSSSSECGHHHHHRRRRRRDDEDIVSLIRSDIAVYGSAVDDVKFPFLPDNFSEFSGSVVYSPNGALGADYGERGSRDHSEAYYAPPHYPQHQHQPSPQQPQQPSLEPSGSGSRASTNKKSRRGKDRLIIRNAKTRDLPTTGDPLMANASGGGGSSQIRGASSRAVRAVAAVAGPSGPTNRPGRHYRRQSASEAYPSTTSVTVVAVANAPAASAAGIRQANSSSNSPAIRPNVLMRFFKRITPKN